MSELHRHPSCDRDRGESVFETAPVTNMPPREMGLRALVTRKWPRGIKKDEIDMWVKELGAPPELIRDFKKGKVTRAGFQARYFGEISTPGRRELSNDLQRRAMAGKKIILVCDTDENLKCPVRDLLKEYLEQT
jgi:uncharacterized protein YeaO (DUF488 family)